MYIDLTQTGNKDIDIEFNGKPITDVVWADDGAGECEVFEKDWRTGELVKDPEGKFGYRSIRLTGKVKIIDRRPKEATGSTVYDFEYPGFCCLSVEPALTATDSSTVQVIDLSTRAVVHTFFLDHISVTAIVDAVMTLHDRLKIHHVMIDGRGVGKAAAQILKHSLNCHIICH